MLKTHFAKRAEGRVPRSWLLALVLLLGACGGGSSAVRYYLIDPVQYPAAESAVNNGPVIEILEVHVPQYLERFHIATRRESNQLYFADTRQWGENLRKNLLRTLATNLSELLGSNDIGTPLNRSMSLPDYRLQVHIDQFERDSDGIVRLVARWQISGQSNTPLTTLKAELQAAGPSDEEDYDAIVVDMQKLFGELSRRIAESIRAAGGQGDGGA